MPDIQILSPHLADLIAAGEVVERPASVVKELVENAFDAGARTVTVELRGGGATYLRVTDDGCGMTPEDAGIAFLRHATSKLHDAQGLEAIGTMGFRGEALAESSEVIMPIHFAVFMPFASRTVCVSPLSMQFAEDMQSQPTNGISAS